MKIKGFGLRAAIAILPLATLSGQAQESSDQTFNLLFHGKGSYAVERMSVSQAEATGRFMFNHLMVEANGYLSPKLSYRYVQRLNKDATTYSLENLSNAIDYAYLRYQANERVTLTAGRQALLVGGFEFNEYPIDVYDFSWFGNNITCYLTGLSTHFKLSPTQEIGLQVTNNRIKDVSTSFGNTTLNPVRIPVIGSMAWNSSYFGHKLQLRYAGSVAPLAQGKNMWTISTGQKVDLGRFNIYLDLLYYHADLDYLGVIRQSGIAGEKIAHTDYLSTILEARYHFTPQWQLYLKAIYDIADAKLTDVENVAKLRRQLYQASIQYHPLKGQHAYIFLNGTYQTFDGLDTPYQFKVSVGTVMRLSLFSAKR